MVKNFFLLLYSGIKARRPFFFGLLALFISLLPQLLLGEKAYISAHDQLDGEVIGYIFEAAAPFAGNYPAFMGGASSTALQPASFGTVLFYMLFSPFTAFTCNYVFVATAAYAGMYLFLKEFTGGAVLPAVAAFLFACLPFYSAYGLSVMGQPLFFYACLLLYRQKNRLRAFALLFCFALFSSVFLIGYANILLLLALLLWAVIKKSPARKDFLLAVMLLGFTYAALNWSFLAERLLSGQVSHRVERGKEIFGLKKSFNNMFLYGSYHAEALHTRIFYLIPPAAALAALFYKRLTPLQKKMLHALLVLVCAAIGIAAFYGLWHWGPVVDARVRIGGVFADFQADRLYWLYPFIWYAALGCLLAMGAEIPHGKRAGAFVRAAAVAGIVVYVALGVYNQLPVKKNILRLTNPSAETTLDSWQDFYAPGLFADIKDYIGRPQQDYRVASIGMHPAAALYNGFYTVDGYSNNYPLAYKKSFRRVIAKELEKSKDLRQYFDEWGNRCYVFSAEAGKRYFFPKNEKAPLRRLQLDTAALKELGCEYIFSALPIQSPHTQGVRFLKAFERPDCAYAVYVYRVL